MIKVVDVTLLPHLIHLYTRLQHFSLLSSDPTAVGVVLCYHLQRMQRSRFVKMFLSHVPISAMAG